MIDKKSFIKTLHGERLVWRRHALERMLSRNISRDNVKKVLKKAEIIEDYYEDRPFPSALFFGYAEERVLHVIAALDKEEELIYVVTAYEPDIRHFQVDMRTRKKR